MAGETEERDRPMETEAEGQCPAVRIENLVRIYRRGLMRPKRAVLDGVNLRIKPGETVALLGPNGSGKSTLLRLIAGAEAWDKGTLEIFGQPPSKAAARAAIGRMGSGEDLPNELRGEEFLQLFGAIGGLRGRDLDSKVASALERVGLAQDRRTLLQRLSLGMKRRLALAAATFTKPALLLLDEPSAGLDAPGQVVLSELMHEAQARGAAILFASHQLDDLAAFADRIVVLNHGRIIADETTADLVDQTGSGRLELDGVSNRDLDELARAAEAQGAQVSGRGPGNAALLRLFAQQDPLREGPLQEDPHEKGSAKQGRKGATSQKR